MSMENYCLWFCKIVTKQQKYRNFFEIGAYQKEKKTLLLMDRNQPPDTKDMIMPTLILTCFCFFN